MSISELQLIRYCMEIIFDDGYLVWDAALMWDGDP